MSPPNANPKAFEAMAPDKCRALQSNLDGAKEQKRQCLARGNEKGAADAQVIIDWAEARLQEGDR